jgi:hypothetical protein
MSTMIGPKLGRAAAGEGEDDETAQADAILQAQLAHRAMGEMLAAFESAGRKRPGALDGVLELLALLRRLRSEIEETWLSKPNVQLETYEGAAWWGPLRDITPTLKNLRR